MGDQVAEEEVAFLSQSLPLTTTYMGTRVHTCIKKEWLFGAGLQAVNCDWGQLSAIPLMPS